MTNCKKNTAIPLLGAGSVQVKNIQFSSNKNEVQVYQIDNLAIQCINDIDSADYLGVKIVNDELVFTDVISGLNTNIFSANGNNPRINITLSGGILKIIGVDDNGMGFAVTQMNVRYDSAASGVRFQI